MKNKKMVTSIAIEFFTISFLATIFHFVFNFFGKNVYIAPFFAVNESVFEHLKLPVFATIIYSIFSHIRSDKKTNYTLGMLLKIVTQILFIIIIYYSYRKLFNKDNMFVDIFSLYFAVFVSILLDRYVIYKIKPNKFLSIHSGIFIILIIIMFVIFTYMPPHVNIFKDEANDYYGIKEML